MSALNHFLAVNLQTAVYVSDNGHVVIRQDDGAGALHIALEPSEVRALISALTSLAPIAGAKRAVIEVWQEAEFRAAQRATLPRSSPTKPARSGRGNHG